MYFMVKSCIDTVWQPELHQNMPYLRICPLITVQYRIPQNSVKTEKFRGNGQIPWFGSKFRVLRKTVVPTYDIIIIIIIRHAPCQCVAPLATNSLHSGLSMASSIASSTSEKQLRVTGNLDHRDRNWWSSIKKTLCLLYKGHSIMSNYTVSQKNCASVILWITP